MSSTPQIIISDFANKLSGWIKAKQKIFFLRGAGCSYYNGIPLLNNFLDSTRRYSPQEWSELSQLLKEIRSSSDLINTNIFNIEELLTFLKTYQIFNPEAKNYYDLCTKTLIPQTLTNTSKNRLMVIVDEPSQGQSTNISKFIDYSSLSHYLIADLVKRYGQNTDEKLFFLATFNYDDLFDTLNNSEEYAAHLHGSIKSDNIVAPTHQKDLLSDNTIKDNWNKSLEFLKDADHIVICGYSAPITDSFFYHFLAIARMKSEMSQTVTITFINPDASLGHNFENRLSKSISGNARVQFITGDNGKFENLFYSIEEVNNRKELREPYISEYLQAVMESQDRLQAMINEGRITGKIKKTDVQKKQEEQRIIDNLKNLPIIEQYREEGLTVIHSRSFVMDNFKNLFP